MTTHEPTDVHVLGDELQNLKNKRDQALGVTRHLYEKQSLLERLQLLTELSAPKGFDNEEIVRQASNMSEQNVLELRKAKQDLAELDKEHSEKIRQIYSAYATKG